MSLKISSLEQEYVPEWRGNRDLPEAEQIKVTFSPLRISDMFEVQKETNVNLMGGFEIDQDDPDSITRYWGLVKTVLSKYIARWHGVIIDDAEITDSSAVMNALSTGHMDLLGELFSEILRMSSGTVEEEKNLESESEPATTDFDGTVEPVSETTSEPSEIAEDISPSVESSQMTLEPVATT